MQVLKRAGFYVHHIKGSHHILKHPEKPELRVNFPFHDTELKRRTLSCIIEQAGYTAEEFIKLL